MELNSKLIYPNPFRAIGIEFDMNEDGIVSLAVVDERGGDVGTVIDRKEYKAGHHRLLVDLGERAAKPYAYRLTVLAGEREYVEAKRIK